jgi:S1-C subfamily serine protease
VNRVDLMRLARKLEGLPVLGSDRPTPQGARYGDIILEVGGIRTKSLEDVLRVRVRPGSTTQVVLFRDGQRKQLDIREAAPPLSHLALGEGAAA